MAIGRNSLTPPNTDFAADVANNFARQPVMSLIGARLARVEPGVVEIELPFRADLTQQYGYLHAGVVTTIADSACGYAAYSLMPKGSEVLSVEFKVNLCCDRRAGNCSSRARKLSRLGEL